MGYTSSTSPDGRRMGDGGDALHVHRSGMSLGSCSLKFSKNGSQVVKELRVGVLEGNEW